MSHLNAVIAYIANDVRILHRDLSTFLPTSAIIDSLASIIETTKIIVILREFA